MIIVAHSESVKKQSSAEAGALEREGVGVGGLSSVAP